MGFCYILMLAFTLLVSASSSTSDYNIIKTLPGYSGDLPFSLESGYIGVGDDEEVQLFYYFIESQRNPAQDPLLFWLTGGPCCSSVAGFFFESGPLVFDYKDYNGSLPILKDNPYAWTQGLNIIYLDAPVGTGFSYSENKSGYAMDDYKFVTQIYEFLQKWLEAHPTYLKNLFYVGGDSYSGIPIPMLAEQIIDGNQNGSVPMMNLKGYVLGNPVTDSFFDMNARVPYANRLSLLSDQLYKAAKTSCDGRYVYVDSSNEACLQDIAAIAQLTKDINIAHILEPSCSNESPTPKEISQARRYLEDLSKGLLSSPPNGPSLWCRSYTHMHATIWANNKGVQDALGVRRGTKLSWKYCNTTCTAAYTKTVESVVSYHQSFSRSADLRALIYSGDHDLSIPHIGTQEWIKTLNLTVDESWRTWSVDGQTAGYTKKLISEVFSLTFVTVKGGGHFAAEYKVKECAAMIGRWMGYFPL